jgi:hypothetical protein
MLMSADTKNYLKKLQCLDPLGSRSKPTVVGARRRCLGGACVHNITPLEEPARSATWRSQRRLMGRAAIGPCHGLAQRKRRRRESRRKRKRRGRDLMGLCPRCVCRLKPTLAGEEKEGRYCCCAPPIFLDAAPWTGGQERRMGGHERWEKIFWKRMGGQESLPPVCSTVPKFQSPHEQLNIMSFFGAGGPK